MTLALAEALARLLVTPNLVPAPPAARRVDPYRANPFFFFVRPYLQVYIPGSSYEAERSSFRVAYGINRRGFRGPDIAAGDAAAGKRLVIIGDSIVEGHGVELDETFAHLLDADMRSRGWRVINAGVAGGSPIYYAANLPRYLALRPDAALLILFENDLYDDRSQESVYETLPMLDDPERLLDDETASGTPWRSRLLLWLRRVWRELEFRRSAVARIAAANRPPPAPTDEQKAWTTAAAHLIAPSMIDRQWSMSQPYLDHVVDTFRRHGVTVVVASLCLGSLAPGADAAYQHRHCWQLDERIAEWARRSGIPHVSLVSLVSDLYRGPRATELMIADDGHPSPLMHRFIAEALRERLAPHLQ